MLKENYHTHTPLCKHANNSIIDTIETAIKANFNVLGFSEHVFLPNDAGLFRIDNKETETLYIQEINKAKKSYSEKIKILCGFECDIVGQDGKTTLDYVKEKKDLDGVDYLIIGHHFYKSGKHAFTHKPSLKEAKEWVSILKKAWLTGSFEYLAHPDGFGAAYKNEWNEVAEYMAQEVTKFSAKYNMPLGINVNGLFEKKGYPSKKFWEIAVKNKAKGIIELDAHQLALFDPKYSIEAFQFVEELGIKLIKLNIL